MSPYTHTEESKKKISASLMGNTNATGNAGHKLSDETKKKLSSAMMGNTNGRGKAGYKMPDETKKRITDALKNRPSHRKGCKHSAETRAKMSEAQRKRQQRIRDGNM